MKHINNMNKNDINHIHIHDSSYEGFRYDYDNRLIEMRCENDYLKKKFTLIFHNVILFEVQSCMFWHGGNAIMYIALSDDSPLAKKYQDLQNMDREKLELTCLDKNDGIQYIPIEIQINSGDMLYLVCESVDFNEEELDVEESRRRHHYPDPDKGWQVDW